MFTIPIAMQYTDWSLFLLRIVVALVFGTSGYSHLKSPSERAKSIGMPVPVTIFLGAAELAGAIALAVGVLTQWAALGLILIMLGAIYKKIAEWHTGFWGEKSMGWHYDLLFIAMNLVILTTGGGHIAFMPA
jgi:putative oxidoreductase